MLTAIRSSDNQKVIGNYIEKDVDAIYLCEYCNKNVIHHKSKVVIRIGHFKHKIGESHCPNQTGETEYHLKTKLDIYSYIKKGWGKKLKALEIEKWLFGNSIRTDVYLETNKNKIAIEVQATILTVAELKDRTEKYSKNGIHVLWILPYEFKRLYKTEQIGTEDDGSSIDTLTEKIKLKEMEIFLYWAYIKRLFFWDLSHKYCPAFICVGLTESKGGDSEFRKDGEDHYHFGKTAKTIKCIDWINDCIEFDQMTTTFVKEFKVPFRDYIIPQRRLFTYDKKERRRE